MWLWVAIARCPECITSIISFVCSFLLSTLSGACAGFQHVVKLSNKFQHRNWNNWAEVAPTFLAPLQTYNWRGTMLWEVGGECWINSFTRNFTNFRDLTSNPFQLFYCKEIVSSEINIIAIWVLIVIFRSVTLFMKYLIGWFCHHPYWQKLHSTQLRIKIIY